MMIRMSPLKLTTGQPWVSFYSRFVCKWVLSILTSDSTVPFSCARLLLELKKRFNAISCFFSKINLLVIFITCEPNCDGCMLKLWSVGRLWEYWVLSIRHLVWHKGIEDLCSNTLTFSEKLEPNVLWRQKRMLDVAWAEDMMKGIKSCHDSKLAI